VFNTTRQVGTVIGTAGVGALLQNRLVAAFADQTRLRAAHLPAAAQHKIIAGFQAAAKSGLEVGSGHRAAGVGGAIFTHGFVQAMRPTMLVPIVFLLAGAACCLFIRPQPQTAAADARAQVGEPKPAAAG
jgi:hypothetical protein